MKKINEFDNVVLKIDLNKIKKGTKGTIIYDYYDGMYEVEFFDNEHRTICVEKISSDYLEVL